jgi:hypothetical protein
MFYSHKEKNDELSSATWHLGDFSCRFYDDFLIQDRVNTAKSNLDYLRSTGAKSKEQIAHWTKYGAKSKEQSDD